MPRTGPASYVSVQYVSITIHITYIIYYTYFYILLKNENLMDLKYQELVKVIW